MLRVMIGIRIFDTCPVDLKSIEPDDFAISLTLPGALNLLESRNYHNPRDGSSGACAISDNYKKMSYLDSEVLRLGESRRSQKIGWRSPNHPRD